MKVSKELIEFIGLWEGFDLKPYLCTGNVWTVGYGTTQINGRPVTPQTRITKEEAIQLKMKDLEKFERAVNRLITVPLNQHQFDALVSFTYNIGEGIEATKDQKGSGLAASTLRRLLNQGDYASVPAQLLRWNRSGGQVTRGLTRRREAEAKVFTQGIYEGP